MTPVIPGAALAVDGVIEINQARALKGGVTPGDAAGFPVTISVSGSYRLTGNLTVDANTNAIYLSADNVSIDLNGFAILGPVTCSGGPPVTSCTPLGTGIGIYGSTTTAISVSNGKIQGMGWNGVLLGARARISDLTVRWSGAGAGIQVGSAATISACNVSENAAGIQTGDGALVSRNVVQGNSGLGVSAQGGATITGNTLRQNGTMGIQLMSSSGGSTVVGNSITANTGVGLSCATAGGTDGYAQNVLNGNNGGAAQVSGCTSLGTGTNLCNGSACP